ncbi:MAG TPA: zf-HC2 domain-containing protein [Candidatus Angelobacter sp.]|nr:zf-HC2 domain-containing protein [Candidatus Angelobacter sp.]
MNAKMIDHEQAIKTMMAERYLLGELTENERDAYEAHLFDCQTCFDQVKAGTEFVSYLKQIGGEEPVPTTVVQPPRRRFLDYF